MRNLFKISLETLLIINPGFIVALPGRKNVTLVLRRYVIVDIGDTPYYSSPTERYIHE